VLGVSRFHPNLDLALLGGQGGQGGRAPTQLLAFLAVLLALLAAAALARRRAGQASPARVPPQPFEPTSDKPLLFLDVAGVIALILRPGSVPAGQWHRFGLVQAYVAENAGAYIRELQSRYEIVWATRWEQGANRYFRPLLGLEHDLHVLEFGLDASSGPSDWKVEAIERAGASRPIAWVDDGIVRRHERWARSREMPTLLIKTDPNKGISEDDMNELREWADALEHRRGRRFARQRRTADRLARR
jgi:hypothetical protein